MSDQPPLLFDRRCLTCHWPLRRRAGEKLNHFTKRRHCGRGCLLARVSYNVAERFAAAIDKNGPNGCWLWLGQKWPAGHGRMLVRGKRMQATHVSLLLAGRPKPSPAAWALHSCDNPPCVNPEHLRWGDHNANMAEMAQRGRAGDVRGVRNGHAKLTDDLVRQLRARDRSLGRWAQELGMSSGSLSMARSGKTWRHVT